MIYRTILYVAITALVFFLLRHFIYPSLPDQKLIDNATLTSSQSDLVRNLASSGIDSILNKAIEDELIPGAVLSITQRGETIYENSYGYAQLYAFGKKRLEPPLRMRLDTRFDLASLTKVFATTFGIMLLADRGKIEVDLPVFRYLPDFLGPSKDSITLKHLLTHSAGLTEWSPVYYHAENPVEARKYICSLPLKYPVGADRHYSDLGFMLLGYIVEEVSGERLDQFLDKNLYKPLGLWNTAFNPSKEGPPFAATSHGNPFEKKMVYDEDFGFKCDEDPESFSDWRDYVLIGEVNDGNSFYAHQGLAGHAGLFSTAADLKILMELLLNKGVYKDRRIISEEIIETFLTKDKYGHGLGWAMSPSAVPVDNLPPGSFGHTGFTGTFAVGIPHYNLSLILLTNRQNLDVNPDGNYNSVTGLRKSVTEMVIELMEKK